jgi:hypothetical protein
MKPVRTMRRTGAAGRDGDWMAEANGAFQVTKNLIQYKEALLNNADD